jgi:hypothetical protein
MTRQGSEKDKLFSNAEEIAYGSDPRNANSLANQVPTALDLNNTTIAENQPAGTVVGKLIGIDPDGNATLAYSRANGQGSKHNNQFFVGPHNNLKAKNPIDFEANASLTVRLKVRDEHNASFEKIFQSSVLNVVEDLDADGIEDHYEPDDANGTGNYAYALVDGNGSSGNASFTLDENGTLRTSKVLYHESNATQAIRIRVTDEHNASIEKIFVIDVIDLPEAGQVPATPTVPDLPAWLSDAQPAGVQAPDWYTSAWFGSFHRTTSPWLYHADLGWIYAVDDGTGKQRLALERRPRMAMDGARPLPIPLPPRRSNLDLFPGSQERPTPLLQPLYAQRRSMSREAEKAIRTG